MTKNKKQGSFINSDQETDTVEIDEKSKEELINNIKPEEADFLIDELPDETKKELLTRFKISMESSYRGPIPPPELLSQFNDVIPNGADRIITMTENQSNHRMEIEKKVVDAKNTDSRLGVVFAGMIGLTGILGGLFLIATGKEVSGFIFSGGSLATLVGVYLRGTHLDVKDLKEKSENNDNSR